MDNPIQYGVTASPADIPPMAPGARWDSSRVDYRSHPAYAGLIGKASSGETLQAWKQFLHGFAGIVVRRLISYELIPYDVRKGGGLGGRLRFLGHGLRNMLRLPIRQARLEHGVADQIYSTMRERGCSVVKIPAPRFELVDAAARPLFERLRLRRGNTAQGGRAFDESRSSASRAENAELFSAIERTLIESGVIDAAGKYLGRKARLIDVNPQINDRSDDFWLNIFGDLNTRPPQTAYFHRDASGGDLKAIIYMTDVGDQNGPFTYVLGSNRMRLRKFDDWICEANDYNGLAATDAGTRRKFVALPAKLRQKGAFGNDLPDNAELSQAIVQSQWAITSPRASIVLFDTKGIHRGGMVREGERLVITCVIA